MPDAPRRIGAAAVPAAVVALLWGRMEEPAAVGALIACAGVALAPAAFASSRARTIAAVAVVVGGISAVFAVSPIAALPRTQGTWLGTVLGDAGDGLRAFERLAVPFDPGERPTMHALVLTAVLVFSLIVALAVAAGRPLVAAAAVVVGGGWATASVTGGTHEVAWGAVLLTGALWPLLVLRARSPRGWVVTGGALAAVAAVGVGVAGAGAVPTEPYLDWKSWSLVGSSQDRVGVRYVWDASYDGIRFPTRRTTVLRIRAERSALYWRASTLDLFTADRWLENLYAIDVGPPSRELPVDSLTPSAAAETAAWVKQDVEVVRLDDERLIGASQPMRLESTSLRRVVFHSGGIMRAPDGVDTGERYSIWSYAPRPLPRDLLTSQAVYPDAALRYLSVDRATVPPFGVPGRERQVDALFRDDRYLALRPYEVVWSDARRIAGDAGSPYEATLAVEGWLRAAGGFRYEEQPPRGEEPPLVDFVARYRAGYCQHFAGTMALMLRMLGVPARVAVGFTSGSWNDGVWDVADRDAHAWVEAWFEGYGWIPFDPTPGRGTLSAGYTFASDSVETVSALNRGALLDVDLGSSAGGGVTAPAAGATSDTLSGRGGAFAGLVVLGVGAAAGALVVLKTLRRRVRYASRDPRRVGLAVRLELEDVLRDQRAPLRRGAGLGELRVAAERAIGVPSGALIDAVARARFASPAQATEGAVDARRELRRLLRLARERLGPARRLRGALSIRSLIPR